MTPSFSIYLEIARILATLVVFVSHGGMFFEPFSDLNETAKLGRDGVIIFFVLSGFVITWCANEREPSFADFAVNRAARIYSVAIPGIFLGAAASIFSAIYLGKNLDYQFFKPWIYLPIYLSFTGSFWTLTETPPSNFPYWSLNYEVWYYIIFAASFYIRSFWRWLIVPALMLAVGPSILNLFPLWIAGSALYYLAPKVILRRSVAMLLVACSLFGVLIVKVTAFDNVVDTYNDALWRLLFGAKSGPPQLLGDYLLGALVAANFLGAYHLDFKFRRSTGRLIKYFASFSFSVYLFHIPIFTILHLFIPTTASFMNYLLILTGSGAVIVWIAKFTEHKKAAYRIAFNKVLALRRRFAA